MADLGPLFLNLVRRYFAFYCFEDYEKTTRPWVPVVVIVISNLLASLYAAPLTFGEKYDIGC